MNGKTSNIRLILILLVVGVISCDPPIREVPDEQEEEPGIIIQLDAVNGWGLYTGITISNSGVATLISSYPELERQLTDEVFDELMNSFEGFEQINYEYEFFCNDITIYTITFTKNGVVKEISIDACAFMEDINPQTLELIQLGAITDSLMDLAEDIYLVEAPWRGLTATFLLDKAAYNVGEDITATYTIENPTALVRELWFRSEEKVAFYVNGSINNVTFHYHYPGNLQNQEGDPSILRLEPGESLNLYHTWNQIFQEEEREIPASSGTHYIRLGMLGGDFEEERITIEIVEN